MMPQPKIFKLLKEPVFQVTMNALQEKVRVHYKCPDWRFNEQDHYCSDECVIEGDITPDETVEIDQFNDLPPADFCGWRIILLDFCQKGLIVPGTYVIRNV